MTKEKPPHKLNAGALINLYRAFGAHLRPHRWFMLSATLCMVLAAGIEILKPWPMKVIFDGILLKNTGADWLLAYLPASASDSNVLLLAMLGAILVLTVSAALLGFGQSYLLSLIGQRVVTSIRIRLYGHIQRLSLGFHDERTTGDLMTRLTSDVQMMREILVNSGLLMLARSMTVVGSLAVMLVMDWPLALIAIAITPLLAFVTWRYGNRIKSASRNIRKREGNLATVMTESISAIKLVQAYARESHEEQRFARQSYAGSKAALESARIESHLERLVQVILAIGTCGVVGFGAMRVNAGILTPGDLLVFTAYLAGLYRPIRKLASVTARTAKGTVSGERILDILRLRPDVEDRIDAVEAPPFLGAITFRGVDFAYANGTQVLYNATFGIRPGESVALMSKSGSGKSTIGNLLLRFYDPQSGSIEIDGHDIRDYTIASIREQVAVVLQDAVLFNATVRDNIAYGRLNATDEDIVRAAVAAGAHDFIMNLPNGYDTVVGERGSLLSGGQRQRITIARAFVRNARILILDEPLTGLDRGSELEVRTALARLMRGRTTVFITHDPDAAKMAQRILTIANGRIYEVHTDGLARIGLAS
jgi:ATP-binding cassette, subfamily B, bacterial